MGSGGEAALGVNRPCARASNGKRQETTGKADILEQHDLLHLVRAAMEHEAGEHTECRQRQRGIFGLEPDQNGDASQDFEDCRSPCERGSAGRPTDVM